jgi:Spy/CpxP family protein refolding chaperone
MERAMGPEGDHGRWWNNPKIAARLKLTDAQRKDFDGILLEHREKLIDLRASLERAELEMEPLISADQPNEAKILAQIDKVAQARADLEKANARFLLAIRSRLTPEQWKLLEAARASLEPPRGGWGPDGRAPKAPGSRGQGANNQRGPAGRGRHQAPPPPPPPGDEPQSGPAAPGSGTGAGVENGPVPGDGAGRGTGAVQ